MNPNKDTTQVKKKDQIQKNDLKKNRISFKQFQQCYQQHVEVQKQKKKTQQQSLNKLSSKNVKPSLQQVNKQNQPCQSNQANKTFFINNQQNLYQNQNQSQKQSQTQQIQPITFNRSVNIKSLYASPKASSMNFMKSINLASNKSKQILNNGNKPVVGNLSNKKVNNQKSYGQSKRNNVSINLNVKPNNIGQNGHRKLSKEENHMQVKKLQSHQMSKNSSLSQMITVDPFQGSLTSLGSQKILRYENPSCFQSSTTQFILQKVNYLSTQLQFLNQFIKQISPIQQNSPSLNTPNVTYKVKLLSQIKNKLHKYEQSSVNENNPLKQLFSNIIELLSNYENDLKKLSTFQIQQKISKSNKALEIFIDQNNNTVDFENRFKRQDSKKKTVKLSKSRRTNQQTLPTESIVHPFESSQFSLLNTSKFTDISRPSSQNKEKSGYFYNEIENIINSKILHQSVDKNENSKPNVFKDQSQSKVKVLIKGSTKTINNPTIAKGIAIKGFQSKSDYFSQQPETKNKVKSVTKTINLMTNPKPQVSQKVPQHNQKPLNVTQKSKTVTMKDILQKNKQKNLLQIQEPSKKLQSQNTQVNKNNFFTDIRQSFGSHNQSIFELEYLENYSSQNHNFPIHHQQTFHNLHNNNKLTIQTGNNINWKQNKYSNKLFM